MPSQGGARARKDIRLDFLMYSIDQYDPTFIAASAPDNRWEAAVWSSKRHEGSVVNRGTRKKCFCKASLEITRRHGAAVPIAGDAPPLPAKGWNSKTATCGSTWPGRRHCRCKHSSEQRLETFGPPDSVRGPPDNV